MRIANILNGFRWLGRVVISSANKFYWDDCFSRASSLAYTTLFSLVPMTALTFAVYRGFEIDESQLEMLLEKILPPNEGELLQNLKEQVLQYLTNIGTKLQIFRPVSIAIVCMSGILLLNTIESAFNAVWRVSADLNIVSKIINYWAVITGGPLLLTVSFYWYARFGDITEDGSFIYTHLLPVLDLIIPVAAIWLALSLMYFKLPAARVAISEALLGGLVGALLFEVTKRAFAYYMGISTTYQTFYGVLVTIPIFLFWIYLLWIVVLFGAEITYQAGSIKVLTGLRKYKSDLGEIGVVLGLRILQVIGNRFVNGEAPPTESDIAIETGSDPVMVRTCLDLLTEAGFISDADTKSHQRALLITPQKIRLSEITKAFIESQKDEKSDEGVQQSAMILTIAKGFGLKDERIGHQKLISFLTKNK